MCSSFRSFPGLDEVVAQHRIGECPADTGTGVSLVADVPPGFAKVFRRRDLLFPGAESQGLRLLQRPVFVLIVGFNGVVDVLHYLFLVFFAFFFGAGARSTLGLVIASLLPVEGSAIARRRSIGIAGPREATSSSGFRAIASEE